MSQAELMETYRAIHFYEGKVKELETQCRRYEKTLSSQDRKNSNKITEILEEMRGSNTELRGSLEQTKAELNKITTQLTRAESKYHQN